MIFHLSLEPVADSAFRSPGGEGMIWNRPLPVAEKPCSKCLVLGMNAGLEFANGADANTDSGYWLHHVSQLIHYNGRMPFPDTT